MNLPQNISLEHRWIANPAAAKGRAIFFGIIALLLLLFTIYAFSGIRDSIWELGEQRRMESVVNLVDTVPHSLNLGGDFTLRPQFQTRIGMWNYNVHLFGQPPIVANLIPSGLLGSYFAPRIEWLSLYERPFALERLIMPSRLPFMVRTMFPAGVYLWMAAGFAMASLYCVTIHRRGVNLPLDDDIKLCK